MADPRIRYDIQANAEGQEDVARLTRELEKLDGAIDPAAAARAQELADKLRQLGQQDAAISRFVELKQKTQGAAQALDEAQTAAQALGKQIAATEAPTRQQAGQMQKLGDAVKSAKLELQNQTAALDGSRKALSSLGLETDGVAKAQIRVRQEMAATAAAAATVTQRYQQNATAATAAGQQQVAAHAAVKGSLQGIQTQIQQIQNLALAAVGGSVLGGMAKDVADVADQYNNLGARIKLVTGEGDAFTSAFESVFEISKRTGSSLETTGNLFARIAHAGKDLGISQKQALELTETINQAIQLSGASSQESDAATRQFIQGLQSGVLRGEEFNSVMENGGRLARALADGYGVTTGELRKMAEAGLITADGALKAISGQSVVLQREFDTLPKTVGRSLQNLSTEWTRYVGSVDAANGVSSKAAAAIGFLADNLSELATVASVAGQAFLAYKAIDLAGSLLRDSAASTAALASKRAEVLATEAAVLARRGEAIALGSATAAKIAATAATTANTAAVGANAVATRAAAAANASEVASTATRAANAGRLTGALALAATGTALFGDLVVSAFSSAGTWIGETAAKLAGYKDRTDEVLQSQKLQDEATQQLAKSSAELAQRTQLAAEKTLGLNDESSKLVGTFTEAQKKGEGVAESLEKVTKALKLGDTAGINAAVTALDVLEKRGAIAAFQISEALGAALKGKDLGLFETQARAAFENTEQGAKRLRLALDAIGDESLRRVGSSVRELESGFSEAMNSAINDTDALRATLKTLGTDADTTSNLLTKSIDKQIEAANTQKAIDRVRTALLEMKKTGELAGDAVADRLLKVDLKAQEAKRGINGLAEAMTVLGIKSNTELAGIADKSKEAFDVALNSGQVSAAALATAFQKMAADAIAANGGIEPSWLRQRQLIVESRLAAQGLSTDLVKGMKAGSTAVDEATTSMDKFYRAMEKLRGFDGGVSGSGITGIKDSALEARNKAFDDTPFQSGSTGGGNYATGQAVNKPTSGEWTYDLNNYEIAGVDAQGKRLPGGWHQVSRDQPLSGASRSVDMGFVLGNGIGANGRTNDERSPEYRALENAMAYEAMARSSARAASFAASAPATVTDTDTPGTRGSYTAVPILGKYEVSLRNDRTGVTTNAFTDTAEQAQAFIDNLQQAFRSSNGG